MSSSSRRRRRSSDAHENEERWLLTYSDMITLLMALFMVLFSISSVNISKYRTLQESLKAAFSGSILPGGKAVIQSGSQATKQHTPATSEIPSIVPLTPNSPNPQNIAAADQNAGSSARQATTHVSAKAIAAAQAAAAAASAEQANFAALKREIDAYARAHGFANQVATIIERRGLVVRVLTDKLLFGSGQATLKPQGLPLLTEVAKLLNIDQTHPIVVEGHTDNVPISSAEYPSNWELSTARATTVVRYLIAHGVDRRRLAAAGYADLHPIASNATATGRQLNRRVEIVFQRLNPIPKS